MSSKLTKMNLKLGHKYDVRWCEFRTSMLTVLCNFHINSLSYAYSRNNNNNNNNNNNTDDRSTSFLFQLISVLVQRFNAVLLNDSVLCWNTTWISVYSS